MQVDMEKITVRATQQLGAQIGALTLQVATAVEVQEAHQARIAELEEAAAEKEAELARARQAAEAQQARIAELEAAAETSAD